LGSFFDALGSPPPPRTPAAAGSEIAGSGKAGSALRALRRSSSLDMDGWEEVDVERDLGRMERE